MKKLLLAFIFIFTTLLGFSQAESKKINRSEVWAGVTLKKKLNKKVSFSVEDQFRTANNLNGIRVNFVEFGVKYKVVNHLAFKAKYRYNLRTEERNSYRYSFDLISKWNFLDKDLKFKYRTRFQATTVEYTGQNIHYFRNQFSLDYKLNKKWTMYTKYESFYKLNEKNEFRANRYALGVKYKVNKKWSVNTFYQIDKEINVKEPVNSRVIGTMLCYDF